MTADHARILRISLGVVALLHVAPAQSERRIKLQQVESPELLRPELDPVVVALPGDLPIHPEFETQVQLSAWRKDRVRVDCRKGVARPRTLKSGRSVEITLRQGRKRIKRRWLIDREGDTATCRFVSVLVGSIGPTRKIYLLDRDRNGSFGEATDSWVLTDYQGIRARGAMGDDMVIGTEVIRIGLEVKGALTVRVLRELGTAERVVRYLNAIRKRAGVPEVKLNEKVTDACAQHARYCLRYGLTHHQLPEKPGYTKAGADAGRKSQLTYATTPEGAVDGLMATLFHRVGLLQPNVTAVGAAVVKNCWVIHTGTVVQPKRAVAVWPPDGEEDVPLHFQMELPVPVFDIHEAGLRECGYPVTITFFESDVRKVTATLWNKETDERIGCRVTDPTRPGNPRFAKKNDDTIMLLPHFALKAQTRYEARVTATVDGTEVVRVWSFKTGGI